MDAAAGLEQPGNCGVIAQSMGRTLLRRQHDVHLHATEGSDLQRAQQPSSGRKYGVTNRTAAWLPPAREQELRQIVDVVVGSVGHAACQDRATVAGRREPALASRRSPVVNVQSVANASCRSATTGPSTRKCTQRTDPAARGRASDPRGCSCRR